jgi:hypothetical protein
VFVGAGSIIATSGGNLTAIALAHGLVIGVMASAVGHISGGHFNPAVTLGFLVARRIEPMLAVVYWSRSSWRPRLPPSYSAGCCRRARSTRPSSVCRCSARGSVRGRGS